MDQSTAEHPDKNIYSTYMAYPSKFNLQASSGFASSQ